MLALHFVFLLLGTSPLSLLFSLFLCLFIFGASTCLSTSIALPYLFFLAPHMFLYFLAFSFVSVRLGASTCLSTSMALPSLFFLAPHMSLYFLAFSFVLLALSSLSLILSASDVSLLLYTSLCLYTSCRLAFLSTSWLLTLSLKGAASKKSGTFGFWNFFSL